MSTFHSLYSAVLLFAGVACIIVAVIVWQYRFRAVGAKPLIALMFALSWWDITYALLWAGVPSPYPTFWLEMTYLGVVFSPVALYVFAFQFAGLERWVSAQLILLLSAIASILFLCAITDHWHGLFFDRALAANTRVILSGGPLFWANLIYSYTLILVACLVLIRFLLQSRGLYRKQALLILSGVLIPWIVNAIVLASFTTPTQIDNTPIMFSIVAFVFSFAIIRYQLLNVVPIAKYVLFESMSDGVVVVDTQNRVLELNRAARQQLNINNERYIGQNLDYVLGSFYQKLTPIALGEQQRIEVQLSDTTPCYLDVQITPVYNQGHRIVGSLIIWRDITSLKQYQAELQQLAMTDTLTNLYNRRYFLNAAEMIIEEMQRLHQPIALILIDIDHFKQINDTYGHIVGDQVLCYFSQLMNHSLRTGDMIARFGGEEFILLLPATTAEEAVMIADQIRTVVAHAAMQMPECSINITISVGVASLEANDITIDMLIHYADQALYHAKANGRNQVQYSHPNAP